MSWRQPLLDEEIVSLLYFPFSCSSIFFRAVSLKARIRSIFQNKIFLRMYNLPPLALLLSLIVTSHIATSTTLFSSSSTLTSTSLSADSASLSATASIHSKSSKLTTTRSVGSRSTQRSQNPSNSSKATITRSTGSIPAQSSQVSTPNSYLNESASATMSPNNSMVNQSLTEGDFYER